MSETKFEKIKGLGSYMKVVRLYTTHNRRLHKASSKNISPLPQFNALARELHPKNTLKVKVQAVQPLNDSITRYYFAPLEGKLPYFRAGQYISIKMKIGNSIVSRPYSICSAPDCYCYSVAIKRAGFFSKYFLDNVKVDDELEISAPTGNFYYEPLRDEKHVIAVVGGSGITPVFSMAEAISKGIEDFHLTILYGVKNIDEMLLDSELEEIQKNSKGKVKVVYVLSESKVLGLESGFINKDLILKYAPKAQPYSLFLCGPKSLYYYIIEQAKDLKLDDKHFRKELFGEITNPFDMPDYPERPLRDLYRLTLNAYGKKYILSAKINESLLVAIEREGLRIPNMCRSGECGWCRSRLISGRIYTPKLVDKVRQADKVNNYIHPCCCYPLSDVEIEVTIE